MTKNHNVIAGVAQVKFRLQTLDSAKKLMQEYSEYEFYREEYRSRNSSQYSFDKIVGNSPRFAEVKKAGYKAAKTMFPVLLTGENRHRQGGFRQCHPQQRRAAGKADGQH